jgi:hypothetical protein
MSGHEDLSIQEAKLRSLNVLTTIADVLNELTSKGATRGEGLTPGNLLFPKDLRVEERMKFQIFKKYKFDRTEEDEIDVLSNIYLPIPQNLMTAYRADYEQAELGAIGRRRGSDAAGGDFAGAFSGENIGGGALNLLSQALTSGGAGAIAGSAIGGKFGSTLAGLLGGTAFTQAAKGAMVGAGIARNPHMAQVFRNVGFRSHSFSYKFSPKNLAESRELKNIVRNFKIAMHPKYLVGNHFFDYPLQFDIDVLDGNNEFLFDIGPSVLTDLQFDPTPNGPYFHYESGQKIPVAVNLTMTFTELSIVTQKEIRDYRY